MGKEAVTQVAHEGAADKLAHFFSKKAFQRDVRVGGMSLEDVAARAQTLIGVYLGQLYFSVKNQQHPWETNGRNAVVWLMTTYLVQLLKTDSKLGINTLLLNPFMRPRVDYSKPIEPLPQIIKAPIERTGVKKLFHTLMTPVRMAWGLTLKLLSPLAPVANAVAKGVDRLINPLRMDVNYVDIMERAGVLVSDADRQAVAAGKKSLWASLDVNKLSRINNLFDELKIAVKDKGLEALSKEDQAIYKALPTFLKRLNIFPLVSTSLITAATVYLVGSVAMKIVYKFIAPLDKDFDPNSLRGQKKQPLLPKLPLAISVAQPRRFAAFSNAIHPQTAQQPQQAGGNA